MFRIPYDPSSGSAERAWLKLIVIFLCAYSVFGSVIFWKCGVCAWCDALFHGRGVVQCSPTLTSIQDLFQPNSWQITVAAVRVYSAPEDGRKGRPKHVQHTCSF